MDPYYQDESVTIYHGDCREIVPGLGRFDLLLTDPPYGIGVDRTMAKQSGTQYGKAASAKRHYEASGWDDATPPRWLLDMLCDHAEKSIVWGGNYFEFPPSRGWLVWDKEINGAFADAELAWTNLESPVRLKRHMWNGMIRKGGEDREHPTQKPIELISWCIGLAGNVQTILDPFAGSGTTGRAAKDLGRKAVLIEREERYCEIAAKRMGQEVFCFA
jgi:site-specific DNA-methyltransferase (adenine-specific)